MCYYSNCIECFVKQWMWICQMNSSSAGHDSTVLWVCRVHGSVMRQSRAHRFTVAPLRHWRGIIINTSLYKLSFVDEIVCVQHQTRCSSRTRIPQVSSHHNNISSSVIIISLWLWLTDFILTYTTSMCEGSEFMH